MQKASFGACTQRFTAEGLGCGGFGFVANSATKLAALDGSINPLPKTPLSPNPETWSPQASTIKPLQQKPTRINHPANEPPQNRLHRNRNRKPFRTCEIEWLGASYPVLSGLVAVVHLESPEHSTLT